jgi:glycosyltransferase involved in cell wall biosynthesis
MTFIGRSPIKFTNIKHVKPLPAGELAPVMQDHDIYIFASKYEACSNALLEALHCGLPAVASNSSSNPEILKNAGELFDSAEEIPHLLEKITKNYSGYQTSISPESIEDVAEKYLCFMRGIHDSVQNKRYRPKKISLLKLGSLYFQLLKLRLVKINDKR